MIFTLAYLRRRAIAYAERWALSRNPLFSDFAGSGGDCTNFVSQCILAGCCTMNFTPTYGWYFRSANDRAPAWTSVEYLYAFLTGAPEFAAENGGIGPFGHEVPAVLAQAGDVVQLADESGDFYHTLMITSVSPDGILVSAHTNAARNRALSSYTYAAARYIHIDGVRTAYPDVGCYRPLIEGLSLPEERGGVPF